MKKFLFVIFVFLSLACFADPSSTTPPPIPPEVESVASTQNSPSENTPPVENQNENKSSEAEVLEKKTREIKSVDPKNRPVYLREYNDEEDGKSGVEVWTVGRPGTYKIFSVEDFEKALEHFEFLVSDSQN